MKTLKKKLSLISIFAILILTLFSSCTPHKSSWDDGAVRTFLAGGSVTEDGYYMRNFTDSEILFYDFKSKQTVPVCNKPDCPHKDPSVCSAYVEGSSLFSPLIAYGDYIYYFSPASATEVKIVRTNADNSGLINIASDNSISDVFSVTAIDNKLYYNGNYNLYSDDEQIIGSVYTVHCLDLETNKVSTVLNKENDPNKRIFFEGCSKEYIYYYEALVSGEVEKTVADGVEYETQKSVECNFKKISLSRLEETVICDASDFNYDYYDSYGAYFSVKKGENEFDFCMLDYDTGKLNKLFTTEHNVTYVISDENRILYSYQKEAAQKYENRNCFVFDKKKKATTELNFTDEGYCSFTVCAVHGDSFIGDFVYDNRQFRAIIKKDDFFSGKLNCDLIQENGSSAYQVKPDVTDDEEKIAEYDSSKLVWVIDDYFTSSEIIQPKLVTLNEDYYDYEYYKKLSDLFKQKGLPLDVEFKMIYIPDPNLGEIPNITGVLEQLIEKGEQIDIVSYYYGESLSCFADLTECFKTEKGMKVKEAVSENVWEALGDMDGKNYFIPFIKALRGDRNAYCVNKELMESKGLKESDLAKSLSELTEVFERIKSDDFRCFSPTDMTASVIFPRFTRIETGHTDMLLAIDTEKPNGHVENIYENQEVTEQLKILQSWNEKGLISDDYEKPCLVSDSRYLGKRTDGLDAVIPLGEVYAEPNVRVKALTVCKATKNIDAAFETIASCIIDSDIYAAMNLWNWNVCQESEMKKYDSLGFYADLAPVKKEYYECLKILYDRFSQKSVPMKGNAMSNYGNPWRGEMADVELGLKELNAELKAAGLDKILDELNRQLDEFYKKSAEQ